MCTTMEITVWLKPFWKDTVALTGEGEASNLNEIRQLNKSKTIQQSVQFLSLRDEDCENFFFFTRITALFIFLGDEKVRPSAVFL